MFPIKVFSHCVDLPGGRQILQEQIDALHKSTLLYNADIILSCNYNMYNYAWAMEQLKGLLNVSFINTDAEPAEEEQPTLMHLQDYCNATHEEFYVLYIHHKGATHIRNKNVHAWRHYMQYFCIEKWEECVNKLNEGYDCVSTDWYEEPWKHFRGNFWWAKASYIRTLPKWQRARDVGYQHQFSHIIHDPKGMPRMENEFWIGMGNPKAYSMHHSNVNPYITYYGPENYGAWAGR